jgi:AP2-associated kinase
LRGYVVLSRRRCKDAHSLAESGGGIIDLLNKRLRDRLKEIEILNIFADVCEVRSAPNSEVPATGRAHLSQAVAAMHSLKRPLLHRDLKVSED